MILQVQSSQSQDKEKITSFFNLFALPTDKIFFMRDEKSVKRVKLDKDINYIITKLNQKDKNETYKIIVGDSSVSSFFVEDMFSSPLEIQLLIYKHIAYHFGYTECKCGGFTVKDKENKKIQVEEVIYIKNDLNFLTPTNLTFVKPDRRNKEQYINKSFNAEFKTTSSILHSILSCKEVHFKADEISYFLKRNDTSYILYCEKRKETFFGKIKDSKELQLSEFFKKSHKEISKFLYKMYIEKDLTGLSVFGKFKKILEKEIDFTWDFLCLVPIFYDNRDDITEKIVEIYDGLDHKKQIKRKGEYLDVRERRYIDSMKFNSLKRYFYING